MLTCLAKMMVTWKGTSGSLVLRFVRTSVSLMFLSLRKAIRGGASNISLV